MVLLCYFTTRRINSPTKKTLIIAEFFCALMSDGWRYLRSITLIVGPVDQSV